MHVHYKLDDVLLCNYSHIRITYNWKHFIHYPLDFI